MEESSSEEKLKRVKTIGIDTEHFVKINTDLLLRRTMEKVLEKDFSELKIPTPFNSRIKNLIMSINYLQKNLLEKANE